MAQKVQTLFIDDLDGSEADGTVRIGLDGTDYEIDLNAEHSGNCEMPSRGTSVRPAGLEAASGVRPFGQRQAPAVLRRPISLTFA